jgi:cyclopropane-fatty-acyl-phospholipid synthase
VNTARLAEAGILPDPLVRWGIRRMCADRSREVSAGSSDERAARKSAWMESLRTSPLALVPELANEQHYEVEPDFFQLALGPRLKYSCGLWNAGVFDLVGAEEAMLDLSCRRARLEDGMRVLDLGCGWGSLSLWIAERYPNARVVSVSNSKLQREFITARAQERGLPQVEVVTADMNRFEAPGRFDRVMSVEMFEHMRNWELLLGRIAGWLEPDGLAFVHHFAHREAGYPYEDRGDGDWMARHFFSGGQMPSHDQLLHFQKDLEVDELWSVNGTHYQKTSDAWLEKLDAHREEATAALARTYGRDAAPLWLRRWRLFFMACAELFGLQDGSEWWVTHARLAPREARS